MIKKRYPFLFSKRSLILSCIAFLSGWTAQAQTVTLFRTNVIVSSYSTVKAAIAAALPGDSLVLSAHRFKESNLSIAKNLKLTGSADSTGISTIDAETKSRGLLISSGNVVLQDLAITNGKVKDDAGGGICNYGSGTLTLLGNSSVTACACSGVYAYGGGIFSAGKLVLSGNTMVANNTTTEDGGGVYAYVSFVMSGKAKLSKNKAAGSGGGVFSIANGAVNLTDSASIDNNTATIAGGGMYGVGTLARQASVTNNTAEFGGGIAAFNDAIFLNDSVRVSNNTATTSGGGIWLNNCNLFGYKSFEISNNIIPAVTGTLNFGGAIYNVNGSVQISGGKITGNRSPVAAIYNSIGSAPKNILINACHIYNPKADGTRQAEVFNSPSLASSAITFSSDACWWGSNDTTMIIANRVGTFSGTITSFVKVAWILNNGSPVLPSMKTFPLRAEFKLQDGSKFDSLSLRSIRGNFMASKGSFNPAMPFIDTLNLMRSIFTSPIKSDSIMITAIVDGDTFRTVKIAVLGLNIEPNSAMSNIKIYPNPATEILYIADAQMGTQVAIISLDGRSIVMQTVNNSTEQINLSNVAAGIYIIQLTTIDGQKIAARIVKQ